MSREQRQVMLVSVMGFLVESPYDDLHHHSPVAPFTCTGSVSARHETRAVSLQLVLNRVRERPGHRLTRIF
jgi:hypothetical protein